MQPAIGRFSVLRDCSGSLLFIRLLESLESLQVEALLGDVAYKTDGFPACTATASIRGRKRPPDIRLVALLLAIPTTSSSVQGFGAEALECDRDKAEKANLILECRDQTGLELKISMPVVRVPSTQVLEAVHGSLFSAVVALEAMIREGSGEKNSSFLVEETKPQTLRSVHDLFLPLTIEGQPVDSHAAFRKAAAADVQRQGNRAFLLAHAAARARDEILDQRRARKEADMRKKRRERELLREAKRRVQLRNELQEQNKSGESPLKTKKKSLFALTPDERVDQRRETASENAKVEYSVQPERRRASGSLIKNPIDGDDASIQAEPVIEPERMRPAKTPKCETGPVPRPDLSTSMPPHKKKRKRPRTLV